MELYRQPEIASVNGVLRTPLVKHGEKEILTVNDRKHEGALAAKGIFSIEAGKWRISDAGIA